MKKDISFIGKRIAFFKDYFVGYLFGLYYLFRIFFPAGRSPGSKKRAENRAVFGELIGNHDLKNSSLYLFGL